MAVQEGAGERRRTRSLDERKRIVEEALAPGASVAAVARRHGLNAISFSNGYGARARGGAIGGASLRTRSLSWSRRREGRTRLHSGEAA